ncbi:MAG: hypothetical protein JWQ64_3602, partial [Subtercola sp.]|nr:hypothetical protein [Subtercola sp.]
ASGEANVADDEVTGAEGEKNKVKA